MEEFVWAQVEEYPYWPAVRLNADVGAQHLFFFGTHEYIWVKKQYILPYIPNKKKFLNKCHSLKFLQAVQEIEEHIKKNTVELTCASCRSRKRNTNNFPTDGPSTSGETRGPSTSASAFQPEQMGTHLNINESLSEIIERCISGNYGNSRLSQVFGDLCHLLYD